MKRFYFKKESGTEIKEDIDVSKFQIKTDNEHAGRQKLIHKYKTDM